MLSVKNFKLPSKNTACKFEAVRPSFWNLAKYFMNPKTGIMREQKTFYGIINNKYG